MRKGKKPASSAQAWDETGIKKILVNEIDRHLNFQLKMFLTNLMVYTVFLGTPLQNADIDLESFLSLDRSKLLEKFFSTLSSTDNEYGYMLWKEQEYYLTRGFFAEQLKTFLVRLHIYLSVQRIKAITDHPIHAATKGGTRFTTETLITQISTSMRHFQDNLAHGYEKELDTFIQTLAPYRFKLRDFNRIRQKCIDIVVLINSVTHLEHTEAIQDILECITLIHDYYHLGFRRSQDTSVELLYNLAGDLPLPLNPSEIAECMNKLSTHHALLDTYHDIFTKLKDYLSRANTPVTTSPPVTQRLSFTPIAQSAVPDESTEDMPDKAPKRWQLSSGPTNEGSSSTPKNETITFCKSELNSEFKPIDNADSPFYFYNAAEMPDDCTEFEFDRYRFCANQNSIGLKALPLDVPIVVKCNINGVEKYHRLTHELKVKSSDRIVCISVNCDQENQRHCLIIGIRLVKQGLHTTGAVRALRESFASRAIALSLPGYPLEENLSKANTARKP